MSPGRFQDHFSGGAADYARYRFAYPAAFFEALAARSPGRRRAWDVGAGSGQASVALAEHFDEVLASEPSGAQLGLAPAHPRVWYRQERAEDAELEDASVDAVLAAQAIHWFDRPVFYARVRRALRPDGLIVASTYAFPEVSPAIDARVLRFAQELGPYWPASSVLPHGRYVGLDFPFPELPFPPFACELQWTIEQLVGNLRTWSGAQRAAAVEGEGRLDALWRDLIPLWGSGPRLVRWPLWVRAGRR
jgi:SAM-dependent methyltransferase